MPPVWPMLLHDSRHSGRAGAFGPATYAAAWRADGLGGFTGVAIDAEGRLVLASDDRHVYCYDAAGSRVWAHAGSAAFAPGPPAIGPSGRVYAANGDVLALDGATGAELWKLPRATPQTIVTAPVTLGPDETVYAVTSTKSGQPNALLAVSAAGTQLWRHTLRLRSSSAPAVGADGTVYVGCDDGSLYALAAADGSLKWKWASAGTIPGAPAIGDDGTVYVGVQAAETQDNALVALAPPQPPAAEPTVRWRYSPSPGEFLSGTGAPALAPDGGVYAGFDGLHALAADGTKRWSTPVDPGDSSPGVPAVGVDGTVYFVTSAGTLWAYSFGGALVWHAPLAAAGATPAIGAGSAIYLGDSADSLHATAAAAPLGPRLARLYAGIAGARRRGPGDAWTYTLDAASVADAAVLGAIRAASAAQSVELAGRFDSLSSADGSVTLSGSGTFMGAAAKLTFTFSPKQGAPDEVAISLSAAVGDAFKLPSVVAALAGTLFDDVRFDGAVLTHRSTTDVPPAATWTLAATTDPHAAGSSLTQAAATLSVPPGPATVAGSVGLVGSLPAVALQVGGTYELARIRWSALPCTLHLETSALDEATDTFVAGVAAAATIGVGSHTVPVRAQLPLAPGPLALRADVAGTARSVSLADLDLWGDGQRGELAVAVPPAMRGGTSFGLDSVGVGLLTDGTVQWIGFRLAAPDWQVLAPSGVGLALSVEDVRLEVVCRNPFDNPTVSGRLGGSVNTQIQLEGGAAERAIFDVAAAAPGFHVHGSLREGTRVSLDSVLSAISGVQTSLPPGAPHPVVTTLDLYAAPLAGTFSLDLGGDLGWTLFELGGRRFELTEVGVRVQRLQRTNDGANPAISLMLRGRLLLAGYPFELAAYSPAGDEGWTFSASTAEPVALPDVGTMVGSFNGEWAGALPDPVARAGQDIVLKDLAAEVGSASAGRRCVRATIGTAAGWGGWTVLTAPIRIALSSVDVDMRADSTDGFAGALRGTMTLDGGSLALSVPLPFDAGAFTVEYDSGADAGLPSIGALVGWIAPSWALPDPVSAIGRALDGARFAFKVAVSRGATTVDLAASAADAQHPWVILDGTPPRLALRDLALTLHRGSSTSGSISGTAAIGAGRLPLAVSMTGDWSTYTVALDTRKEPAQVPNVGELVALVSPALAESLPQAVRDWGSGITVSRLEARVAAAGTTLDVAAGAPPAASWPIVPGRPSFALRGMALYASGGASGTPAPSGGVSGTIVAGERGRIPLRAALSPSASTVRASLDPAGGSATLPTVGDVAALFDPAWRAALPDALARVGEGMALRRFDLEARGDGGSVDVEIGTPSGWRWKPVDAFPRLELTDASLAFKWGSGEGARPQATAESTLALMGQSVKFTLTLPEAVLMAALLTEMTLQVVCDHVTGAAVKLPGWLTSVGLREVRIAAAFRENAYSLEARLARDVPLPHGGRLKDATLKASVTAVEAKVCIYATWVTAEGREVRGEICLPFESFKPDADPTHPVPFPPDRPPPGPGPDYPAVAALVAELLTAGVAIGTILALLVYGVGATPVAAAGALLAGGAEMTAIAPELAAAYPEVANAEALAKTLNEGSKLGLKHDASASSIARSLVAAFPSIGAREVAAALVGLFGLGAAAVVAALKPAGFRLRDISPAVRSRFAIDAATMIADLDEGWRPDAISAAEMVQALATAPYAPVDAAAPVASRYRSEVATGAQFALLFIGAGFSPPIEPPAMARALAAASFDASQAIGGLRVAYPSEVPNDTAAAPYLRQAGYSADAVVPALRLGLPQAPDMARVLASAGYGAPQSAHALVVSYGEQIADAAALLGLLEGGWPSLSLAEAGESLARAAYPPPAFAQAVRTSARFGPQVDTAAKLADLVYASYAPVGGVTIGDMLRALATVRFPAYAVAAAAVPHYAGTAAAAVATGLTASYPNLDPLSLGAALAAARFDGAAIASGIAAGLPEASPAVGQAIGQALAGADIGRLLSTVESAKADGKSARVVAAELVKSTPAIAAEVVGAGLDAVYGLPLSDLGWALLPAWTPFPFVPGARVLALAAAARSPLQEISDLLVEVHLKVVGWAPDDRDVAPALVAAAAAIGAPTDARTLMGVIVRSYARWPVQPWDAARTVLAALPSTGIEDMLRALLAAYGPGRVPQAMASALQAAYQLTHEQAPQLVSVLSRVYGVTTCPIGTGFACVPLHALGFQHDQAERAIQHVMSGYGDDDRETLAEVFKDSPDWAEAAARASAQYDPLDAARELKAQYAWIKPRLLSNLVASCWGFVDPVTAAQRVGHVLKRTETSLDDAREALQWLFASAWSETALEALRHVYERE